MTDYSTAICRSYRTILHVMMLFVIIKQANMGKMIRLITIIIFVIVTIPIIMLIILRIANWFDILIPRSSYQRGRSKILFSIGLI